MSGRGRQPHSFCGAGGRLEMPAPTGMQGWGGTHMHPIAMGLSLPAPAFGFVFFPFTGRCQGGYVRYLLPSRPKYLSRMSKDIYHPVGGSPRVLPARQGAPMGPPHEGVALCTVMQRCPALAEPWLNVSN